MSLVDIQNISIRGAKALTLKRQVPPMTIPYDMQSIITGQEKTPSLRE